jgi:hypothetical protein
MLPNLQQISVTPLLYRKFLSLENVCCEKLSLIQCPNLFRLFYQPPLADFNQTNFEAKLEEFLLKQHSIKSLTIGRNEWIALDIKLSLEFWKKILQLPNLVRLAISHPGNVVDLVNLLKAAERNFSSLVIIINAIGKKSVMNDELPSWIKMQVIQ